jgi:LysR family glycine cleavage system transcriptional activator
MNEIHMRRYRNVPPLQFLQGFEAAARLGSFTEAALELGLSQSAVSHQMRLLEDRMGQPLFLRIGRTVRLTDAGRDYQRTVRRCLDELQAGYRKLAPYSKPGSVVIYAPRDFASRWLLPRLSDLRRSCPGSDPWIDTSGAAVDFDEMEVSIAIVYAEAAPSSGLTVPIAVDTLAPVVAPALIGTRRLKAGDVPTFPLLHDERDLGWSEWFERANVEAGDVSAGIDFSDSDLALAAAERGLGFALASIPLAKSAIDAGRLVKPFEQCLDPKRTWFATTTTKQHEDNFTSAVWQWFEREAAR